MILRINTDGGAKGNPGPAAIGVVACLDDQEIFTYREDLGVATNNEAEYLGLIRALEKVASGAVTKQEFERIECRADSLLMVNQLNGLWKVKEARIREFVMKIRILEGTINKPISYKHVPREQNKIADALVNDDYKKS